MTSTPPHRSSSVTERREFFESLAAAPSPAATGVAARRRGGRTSLRSSEKKQEQRRDVQAAFGAADKPDAGEGSAQGSTGAVAPMVVSGSVSRPISKDTPRPGAGDEPVAAASNTTKTPAQIEEMRRKRMTRAMERRSSVLDKKKQIILLANIKLSDMMKEEQRRNGSAAPDKGKQPDMPPPVGIVPVKSGKEKSASLSRASGKAKATTIAPIRSSGSRGSSKAKLAGGVPRQQRSAALAADLAAAKENTKPLPVTPAEDRTLAPRAASWVSWNGSDDDAIDSAAGVSPPRRQAVQGAQSPPEPAMQSVLQHRASGDKWVAIGAGSGSEDEATPGSMAVSKRRSSSGSSGARRRRKHHSRSPGKAQAPTAQPVATLEPDAGATASAKQRRRSSSDRSTDRTASNTVTSPNGSVSSSSPDQAAQRRHSGPAPLLPSASAPTLLAPPRDVRSQQVKASAAAKKPELTTAASLTSLGSAKDAGPTVLSVPSTRPALKRPDASSEWQHSERTMAIAKMLQHPESHKHHDHTHHADLGHEEHDIPAPEIMTPQQWHEKIDNENLSDLSAGAVTDDSD